MILTKIGKKIARIAQLLDNPDLFRLRQKGVSIDTFLKLNQPWLLEAKINTVFDIGANVGQFANLIHEVLPTAKIYSFEPLEDCYKELKERMRKVHLKPNHKPKLNKRRLNSGSGIWGICDEKRGFNNDSKNQKINT